MGRMAAVVHCEQLRFQSTHPVWGGTPTCISTSCKRRFQSTHPVWGGTPRRHRPSGNRRISIHPPRVGWDRADVPFIGGKYDFNPPTPCGVGLGFLSAVSSPERFQSTHPVWGGTALLSALGLSDQFQSTHPVWGGTLRKLDTDDTVDISIHPPRVGWDCSTCPQRRFSSYFNPPTPCGVGQQ